MKKRILSLFTTLAMLCGFIGIIPIFYVNAVTNPYPIAGVKGGGAWSNCTWSAWQLAYDTLGIELPKFGHAKEWFSNAKKAGYLTGTDPKSNSIMCFTDSNLGHVGFVTQVSDDGKKVYLKEGGFQYRDGTVGKHEEWTNATGVRYGQTILGYIYLEVHQHSYTSNITVFPTCTEQGIRTYTCTCGDSYTEVIPAAGHSYIDTVVEPTLETKGYTEHKCGKCGHSYIDNYVDELRDESYTYVDKLPDNITPDNYEIQYKCSYETTSTQSPGDGWHKGALVSEGYENVGEPFETAKYVETSDNCVMLNYRYYHYCGGSTGTQANYESTGNLVHYDCIYPDDSLFYVKRTDMDGEYPWFVLGWKSNDKNVLCESGFSCDGTYGTHGQRTNAWYRMATYQRRQYVSYYTYTKSTKWGSEYDENANKIECRYKLIKNDMIGDVNNDHEVNVSDIVMIQKWLTNKTVITNSNNADINSDGKVNVFDIIILKRIIMKG